MTPVHLLHAFLIYCCCKFVQQIIYCESITKCFVDCQSSGGKTDLHCTSG